MMLPARIENIATKGSRKRVTLSDREVDLDFIFFATGAGPNIELAQKAGLEVGETGTIAYTVSNYLGFPPVNGTVLMENKEAVDLSCTSRGWHHPGYPVKVRRIRV